FEQRIPLESQRETPRDLVQQYLPFDTFAVPALGAAPRDEPTDGRVDARQRRGHPVAAQCDRPVWPRSPASATFGQAHQRILGLTAEDDLDWSSVRAGVHRGLETLGREPDHGARVAQRWHTAFNDQAWLVRSPRFARRVLPQVTQQRELLTAPAQEC